MPDYLSWSQFDTFASCGVKYKLSYIDKVPQAPRGYFMGGSAVHRTIEESEALGWWGDPDRFLTDGEATAFFHAQLESEVTKAVGDITWGGRKTKASPGGEDLKWWHASGPMMLRRYASLRREDHAKGFPTPKTEVKVSFPGPGDKPVIGYIDQLFEPLPHEVGSFDGIVRDYKTGSRFKPDHPLQLVLYGRAIRDTVGYEVARGQFVYLRAQDGRLVHEVNLSPWYTLLDTLMEEWQAAMETGQFIHRPGWQCATCDVGPYCEVGRKLGGEDEGE